MRLRHLLILLLCSLSCICINRAYSQPCTSVFEIDTDADGTVDSRRTTTSTYDGGGNLLTEVLESDNTADGTVDFRTTTTNEYDGSGNLLTSLLESDGNADGTIDSRITTTLSLIHISEPTRPY